LNLSDEDPQSSPHKPSSRDWTVHGDSDDQQLAGPSRKAPLQQKQGTPRVYGTENEDEERVEEQLGSGDEDEDPLALVYSPSAVPDEEEERQEYLMALCEYGEYHNFVDAIFHHTVGISIHLS
jgi:hypothetical protein